MPIVTIQFDGLCCHVKPPSGLQRRVILPDARAHLHLCYIEFFLTDFDRALNPGWTLKKHRRNGVQYGRVEFVNARISLANTIQSTTYTEDFKGRVPLLRDDVCPTFTSVKSDLLRDPIPTNLVAAYFDITVGTLTAGNAEHLPTRFRPQHNWGRATMGLNRAAEWVQLDIDLAAGPLKIDITDLASPSSPAAKRTLTLNTGTVQITIGNQQLEDIEGREVRTPRPGHFEVYYDLAGNSLSTRPVPEFGQGLGTGCMNSSWP